MPESHTGHSLNNTLLTAIVSALLLSLVAVAALPSVRVAATQQSQPKSQPKSKPKSNPKSNPGSNPPTPNPTQQQSGIASKGLPQVTADTSTIKTILQIGFAIIGAFALFSVTASGFKYITSAGNPQKTSEAKSGVIYAIVGLMLAITAEAIVAFVIHWGAPS